MGDTFKDGVLAICSGGLDSTVMMYALARSGRLRGALSFNYGQRHVKEIDFARVSCAKLGIPFDVADISNLAPLFGNNALTNKGVSVPRDDYNSDNMSLTVVPNRNMVFLSIAAARAIALGCNAVSYAAHGGDHALYPDCRTEFADALSSALSLCHYYPIALERPFINISKADIVKLGADLGVDFSDTWSCYEGGKIHCGKCGTCRERREAFKIAGVKDPTEYASD